MKRLLIMRHAEASHAADDHERPLTPGGEQMAAAVGRRMAAAGVGVDAIISSTAVRAMQTAVCVRDALVPGHAAPVEFHTVTRLYNAPVAAWREVVAGLSEAWDDVLMVGHNPAVASIAAASGGEPVAVPPATVIDLRLPSWTSLLAEGTRLAAVWRPGEE